MQLVKDGKAIWEGSVHDLLCAASDPDKAELMYRKAMAECPNASAGTKRKWARLMDLKYGVEVTGEVGKG